MTIAVKDLSIGHNGYLNGVRCFIGEPNSAGGVSVKGSIVNIGDKTFENITLLLIPLDEKGDSVSCSVRRESERKIDISGPLLPDASLEFFGENLWYNYSIRSCSIVYAYIVCTNGETEKISGSKIKIN